MNAKHRMAPGPGIGNRRADQGLSFMGAVKQSFGPRCFSDELEGEHEPQMTEPTHNLRVAREVCVGQTHAMRTG